MSLENIYRSWFLFCKGKKRSEELESFQYHLERELVLLHEDLKNGRYVHGGYKNYMVYDPKKREICVATMRDRVVHRLLYEYLVPIFDQTFPYDVWSCRKGKGLSAAIERVQFFISKYPHAFIFRADVQKFFDNVDHDRLKQMLRRKVVDAKAMDILEVVIDSYHVQGHQVNDLTFSDRVPALAGQVRSGAFLLVTSLVRFLRISTSMGWIDL